MANFTLDDAWREWAEGINREHFKQKYSAHFLPGRGPRAGNGKIGVIHAVEATHGDNFNTALCGKKPSGLSLGWLDIDREITCEKCLKIMIDKTR